MSDTIDQITAKVKQNLVNLNNRQHLLEKEYFAGILTSNDEDFKIALEAIKPSDLNTNFHQKILSLLKKHQTNNLTNLLFLDDPTITFEEISLLKDYIRNDPGPSDFNIAARTIKNINLKRLMFNRLQTLHVAASNGDSPHEILSKIQILEESLSKSLEDLDELKLDDTSAVNYTTTPPLPRDYVLNLYEKGCLSSGVVGCIVGMGGVSKSFLSLHLAAIIANGQKFGPFSANGRHRRVIYVSLEDDELILHERTYAMYKSGININKNFHVKSLVGQGLGFFVETKKGELVHGKFFNFLDKELNRIKKEGLSVLFVDPISRINGTDENDNNAGTFFVDSFEYLAKKYGITIILVAHANKSSDENKGRMTQNMLRGASAIAAACRWLAGVRSILKTDSDKYKIPLETGIELAVVKTNYASPSGPIYFERGENGVIKSLTPQTTRLQDMIPEFLALIEGKDFSRRELKSRAEGKEVAQSMRDTFESFSRATDIPELIDESLRIGYLQEVRKPVGDKHTPKLCLEVLSQIL